MLNIKPSLRMHPPPKGHGPGYDPRPESRAGVEGFFVGVDADIKLVVGGEFNLLEPFLFV